MATTSVVLKPGFHVPSGSTLSARIGSTQQEAHQAAMADPDGFRQVIDYRYNIRGWLETINDPNAPDPGDLFSMKLNYNKPTAYGGDAQYNGNISETIWKTVGYDKQSYGYDYDPMNRILEADYFNLTNPAENNRFNERIGDGTAQRPAYDLNGNINLLRNSKKAAVAQGNIDNLTYKYIGNQLHVVNDATADHADEIGFKELVEKSFSETSPSSWEYAYDANGTMIRDDNKGITSIEYNHLNLPRKVSKSTSEYIVYTYDATGRKLKQEVFGPEAKVTHYAGEMIFEDNALQFINHEEGRVVMTGAAPEYQYHLKDHLGNVRLTLTSTPGQETAATAGFETADMAEEQGEFLHYAHARKVQATLFDRTNGSSPGYSQRLNGSEKEAYGLAKSLAVMPGDVVNAEVYVKYADPESSNWNTALTNLIAAIANNTGGIIVDGEQYPTALTENDFPGVVNTGSSSAAVPKAFLNWMVFDADFQFLDGGFVQVSTAARETGTGGPHERLAKDNIVITQPGYVYIYLSNENGDLVEVFFDDFEVEHVHGEVVQVEDYYPFGLTFNSYSRENSTPNMYQYNGKEKQDELNLGWLDYSARMYIPEIGGWGAADPLAEAAHSLTPYRYGFNNPVRFLDPNGMYETDGHFWTVYLAATLTMRNHGQDPYGLAYFAEAPEHVMNERGDVQYATNTWFPGLGYQYDFHALGGSSRYAEAQRSRQKYAGAGV